MVIIKLNELLKQKGVTIYRLSKMINVSQNNLSDFSNSKRTSINIRYLDALCNVLDCRIEDLLEHRKDNNNL